MFLLPLFQIVFVCDINFGLRIGDLLKLKVGDVKKAGNDSGIKDNFEIKEQKTDKLNMVEINENAKKALKFLFARTNLDNSFDNFTIPKNPQD